MSPEAIYIGGTIVSVMLAAWWWWRVTLFMDVVENRLRDIDRNIEKLREQK